MSVLNQEFPDRKEILKKIKEQKSSYLSSIIEDVKSINLEDIDYDSIGEDQFQPRMEIKEKQKEYFWIRLFTKEEIKIEKEDKVIIVDNVNDEKLETIFMFYSKKNSIRDFDNSVVNFDSEEDKKCLILMIDSEKINSNSDHIPFIRTLFKSSRWYEQSVIRIEDLDFILNGQKIEYYRVDF